MTPDLRDKGFKTLAALADVNVPYGPELATIYVNNTSSVKNGSGQSESDPVRSIREALALIPMYRSEVTFVTLVLANTGTPYVLPASDPAGINWNRISIEGELPSPVTGLESVAVTSVTTTGVSVGGTEAELTLTGRLAGDLAGLFVSFTGGSANGRLGWCYDNDATSGTTRALITQDRDGGPQDCSASTLAFYDPADFVQIDLQGKDLTLIHCEILRFRRCSFVSTGGTKKIVHQGSCRVTYEYCHFSNQISYLSFFENGVFAELRASWFEQIGQGNKFGMIAVNRADGVFINVRSGCVWDGANAAAGAKRPFAIHEGAWGGIGFQGYVVFKGCEAVSCDAHHFIGLTEGYNGARAVLAYEHSDTHPVFNLGERIDLDYMGNTNGVTLPDLYGSINFDYCVVAQGVSVTLGRGSSITCDADGTPVVNQVSLDAGDSACSGVAFENTFCILDRDSDLAGWTNFVQTPASASPTIEVDGKNGRFQEIDLTGSTGTATINLSQLVIGGWITLMVTQAATAITLNWTSVLWAGGTAPNIGNGATGLVKIHWDGTTLRGVVEGNSFS